MDTSYCSKYITNGHGHCPEDTYQLQKQRGMLQWLKKNIGTKSKSIARKDTSLCSAHILELLRLILAVAVKKVKTY